MSFEYQIGTYICNLDQVLDAIMSSYLYLGSEDSDDDDEGLDPGPAIARQNDRWGGNAHQAAVMASALLPVFNATTSTVTLGLAC
jgi:hypothetical protein